MALNMYSALKVSPSLGLQSQGNVQVVGLEGADREASLIRGGDGYVARFNGGYVTANSREPIRLTGKNASICLRLRDPSGKWTDGLLATADSKDRLANLVYGNGPELVYRWRTSPAWLRKFNAWHRRTTIRCQGI